ncbi:MAG: EAL domain-containing protein [Xanthomonadales bacterium]|nr:EAL domain-containing protein [Xanthomonadales bacterium]
MRSGSALSRWCLGWLVWLAGLVAGSAAAAEVDGRFHRLGVEQGLPNANVTALLQDRLGFLWIGTQSGLFRYDGYQFRAYRRAPEAGAGLSDGWVWALHEDIDGQLWVGTLDGGLNRFDPKQRRFELFRPHAPLDRTLPVPAARALDSDRGALWLGSAAGLWRVDRRSGQALAWPEDSDAAVRERQRPISALAADGAGGAFVASGRSLGHWTAEGVWQPIGIPEGLPSLAISALHRASDGALWVGGADGRVGWLPNGANQLQALPPPPGLAAGAVTALASDAEGRLWLGTFADGLWQLAADHRQWRHFPAQPSNPLGLMDGRVSALLADRSGGLWVASWNHGLHRLDLVSVGFARVGADDEADWQVYAITGTGDGGLWLGTIGHGVQRVRADGRPLQSFRHRADDPDSLSSDVVRSLLHDRRGVLWVGTHVGLDRLRADGGFDHFRHDGDPKHLGEGPVRAILEDRQGRFWVGTELSGLHLFDRASGRVERFRHQAGQNGSLGHDWVNVLFEDRRGQLWIGTQGGLSRWREASRDFSTWRHRAGDPQSLAHDRVNCLFEDSRERLWVCTGAGLDQVEQNADALRFIVHGPEQGLAADSVGAVLEAPDGRLWLSTTAGLSSLDPDSGRIRNYGARDGASPNGYFVHSGDASADRQRLYFGGLRGVSVVQPALVRDNPFPPPVLLTDLLLFNSAVPLSWQQADSPLAQAVEFAPSLRLDHRQSVFAFEFAAPHFADPANNRYRYRLVGFDRDWQETPASRRFATYTNLAPGHYRFEVAASNKDGLWSPQPAAVEIDVLPPPWRSPLAYIGYVLALAALGGRWAWTRREKRRTERRYLAAVRASEERLKLALWGSGDSVWDWDLVQDTVHRAGLGFLGYDTEELAPTISTMEALIHPDDLPGVMERLDRLRRGQARDYSAEFRVRTKDGRWLWVLDRGKVVETDPATGQVTRIAGTLKNDQARKEVEQALLQLAKYDPLTGLPNRAMFLERLHAALLQARRHGTQLALLFVDLDRFKHVNDSLGHAVGDGLLKEVGQRLRHRLREGDLVARLGGDEFTIMLEGIQGAHEVAALANLLLQVFAQPVVVEGRELAVGLSIGISLFPSDGDDADVLLQHADTAMYGAKNAGRNGFQFYTAEMNVAVVRRLAIENGLRRCIERGELRLVYQPRIGIACGRFSGAESLARWDSAELGSVEPSEFIPVAEDSGLILPLGEWLLRCACTQYMRWQEAGLPAFSLSVNVSALQLTRGGLVGLVQRILDETGMPATQLELEITETAVMSNADLAIEVLGQLKALGVRIAIDDFGIGYSSLSHLKRFPIDILKVDRSFVFDIGHDPDDTAIVSAIIAMAHALQHVVVAEGVESPEQLALLRQKHCDQAQGYHHSRPLEAAAFAAYVLGQVEREAAERGRQEESA